MEKFWRGENLAQLTQNENFVRQSNKNTRHKSIERLKNLICAKLNPRQNFSTKGKKTEISKFFIDSKPAKVIRYEQ